MMHILTSSQTYIFICWFSCRIMIMKCFIINDFRLGLYRKSHFLNENAPPGRFEVVTVFSLYREFSILFSWFFSFRLACANMDFIVSEHKKYRTDLPLWIFANKRFGKHPFKFTYHKGLRPGRAPLFVFIMPDLFQKVLCTHKQYYPYCTELWTSQIQT